MQRFVEKTSKTQIANPNLTGRRDHDIGGLQISMEDPVAMQILATVEQLEHDTLHGGWRYGMTCRLGMVMDDLQQVMLSILENHVDTLVFQNDLNKLDDVYMAKFRT